MQIWSKVLNLFREYMGTGLIVIWFLAGLIFLWKTEKRKNVRILFIYVPIILLLLFFNPLFAAVVYKVAGDEIYYRILWLLPMTVTIAFSVVKIITELKGKKQVVFGVLAAVILAVTGGYIYSNPYFKKAENFYHVPQVVVDICEAIEIEGREVKAIFPLELVQYVRQYSPVVCMPYGREMLVNRWNQENILYDIFEAEEVDVKLLTENCREQWVAYIVLPAEKKLNGSLEDYEFEYFATIGQYTIYKDATVNLAVE